MILKKARFDNPKIYQTPRPLQLGDYILQGSIGIWHVTHYDERQDRWWCGGLKTSFEYDTVMYNIFRPEFILWIQSLYKPFHVGDFVAGLDADNKRIEGIVESNNYPTISLPNLWIKTPNGYTSYVNITTAKRL